MKHCESLWAHSLDDPYMQTVEADKDHYKRICGACGFTETLPRTQRPHHFINTNLLQTKQAGWDDNQKQMLQPTLPNGQINEEFKEAYGHNPYETPAT